MPGFPNDGRAAHAFNFFEHNRGTFDVADNGRAGVFFQYAARIKCHENITAQNIAFVINHADAVTITIKGDAEIALFPVYQLDKITQVFINRGVRVMVGVRVRVKGVVPAVSIY